MSDIRDIRNKTRRDIHDNAAVPAWYIVQPGSEPLHTRCRVHPHGKLVGAMPNAGSPAAYARMTEQTPELVFLVGEGPVAFRQGAIVTISATEAYRVESPDTDGIEITVRACALLPAQAAALPHPPG